jgi:hypothetical protein
MEVARPDALLRPALARFHRARAQAEFVIEPICEPELSEALKAADPEGYERLRRFPAFVSVRARFDS